MNAIIVKVHEQKPEPQDTDALDRVFWLAIRAALIQMVKAIERRFMT